LITRKKIWWDIRLHPFFDTLEVRVCDAQTRWTIRSAIAALIQALIAKLHKCFDKMLPSGFTGGRLLDEIGWRASRYGIDGKLIDFGQETRNGDAQFDSRVHRVCADEIAELGSRREMNHIERILHEGTGADRQIAVLGTDARYESCGR